MDNKRRGVYAREDFGEVWDGDGGRERRRRSRRRT